MDSLVRRIKDLDQTTFQQLCFHVVSEQFPSAKVRYPEGAAGDEGVDLFEGDLTEGATVWQCKAFMVSILGDSQKQQIRDSLRDVVKNVQPKLWILCLNLSLDIKAARWFQRLQKSYAKQGVAVADPFDAMDLARELMYRRTIRNHFFPNLALDVQELKSLMKATASGVDSINDRDLETLATENSEELLDRLHRQDPRFSYEVTFGGERGPNVFPPPHEPHLISSMTDGRKTFKAYVRDHEALRQDPVGFNFEFTPAGGEKLADLIRTGKPQTWAPAEVRAFRSSVPLLSSMKFVPGELGFTVQSLPDDRVIPLKLSFSKAEEQATLDYVEFRKLRAGTHEVEIATVESNPLNMAFVLPFDKACEVEATISTNFPGKPIRDVATACRSLKLLQSGCTLEITSLKLNGHLCTLSVNPLPAPFKPKFFQFVKDLAAIADRFQVDLRMPDTLRLSPEDEETFSLLRAFVRNEPIELDGFTAKVVKSLENATLIPEQFRDEMTLRLERENSAATLFGTPIRIGASRIQLDRAEVVQRASTMKRFINAPMGAGVPIRLRPLAPVRFELLERSSLSSSQS